MSAKDAPDGKQPIENDRFGRELALFLSEEWRPVFEEHEHGGFDVSDFLAELYNVDGICFLPTAVEVPLDAFLAAQQADALRNLEIAVDRHVRTYLVGMRSRR